MMSASPPQRPGPLIARITARPERLAELGAALRRTLAGPAFAAPRPLIDAVELAVHELAANVAVHGASADQPACIELSARRRGDAIEVLVVDSGRSFDPGAVPPPDPAVFQVGGYGLYLVRSLVDSATYQTGPFGNAWRLVAHLPTRTET